MDGDEGKGTEVDKDGSVSVNVCSDARDDVVADELVVTKGITVDTVMDGDEGVEGHFIDVDGGTKRMQEGGFRCADIGGRGMEG